MAPDRDPRVGIGKRNAGEPGGRAAGNALPCYSSIRGPQDGAFPSHGDHGMVIQRSHRAKEIPSWIRVLEGPTGIAADLGQADSSYPNIENRIPKYLHFFLPPNFTLTMSMPPSVVRTKPQKISFTCTHMLRMPLSVKSRFRKRDGSPPAGPSALKTFRSGTCVNCGWLKALIASQRNSSRLPLADREGLEQRSGRSCWSRP